MLEPHERTRAAASERLGKAAEPSAPTPSSSGSSSTTEAEAAFFADAEGWSQYFELEDPTTFDRSASSSCSRPTSATYAAAGHHRPPRARRRRRAHRHRLQDRQGPHRSSYEHGRLGRRALLRLHVRAALRAAAVQGAAAVPARARPSSPHPPSSSIPGLERKVDAMWHAVERACAHDDFRPRPSKLCDWCGFRAHCPAHGGTSCRGADEVATTSGPGFMSEGPGASVARFDAATDAFRRLRDPTPDRVFESPPPSATGACCGTGSPRARALTNATSVWVSPRLGCRSASWRNRSSSTRGSNGSSSGSSPHRPSHRPRTRCASPPPAASRAGTPASAFFAATCVAERSTPAASRCTPSWRHPSR